MGRAQLKKKEKKEREREDYGTASYIHEPGMDMDIEAWK